MLLVTCLHCNTAVRVMGDPIQIGLLIGDGSEFWPDHYTCVACGKACTGCFENEAELDALAKLKIRELTPEEMYAAQMGLGTPDEMLCDASTVRELLQQSIKKVNGFNVKGTSRFCLTDLELESGVRLFFGSSSHGAIVYRISRPFSYQEKALEESSGE